MDKETEALLLSLASLDIWELSNDELYDAMCAYRDEAKAILARDGGYSDQTHSMIAAALAREEDAPQ